MANAAPSHERGGGLSARVPRVAEGGSAFASAGPMADEQFYARPEGLEAAVPGQILRSRAITAYGLQKIPLGVDAWQVLYRTTSESGEPDYTATTIFKPVGATPTKLVSHQVAIDAVAPRNAPSRAITTRTILGRDESGRRVGLSTPAVETLISSLAVARGWAVSIPDFGGSGSHFLLPRQHGYCILDGIRAALSFAPLRLSAGAEVGLIGYSGGGMASTLAAEAHAEYAPELNIAGVVAGAPLRDVGAAVRRVRGSLLVGLIPMGLASLVKHKPELREEILRDVSPAGRRKVDAALEQTTLQTLFGSLRLNYEKFFTAPVDVFANRDVLKAEMDRIAEPVGTPIAPLYLYSGVSDEVVVIESVDRLADRYCQGPSPVTYRRHRFPTNLLPAINSPHILVLLTGLLDALDWLEARLGGGAAPARNDVQTVVTTAFRRGAVRRWPATLKTLLQYFSGRTITTGKGRAGV